MQALKSAISLGLHNSKHYSNAYLPNGWSDLNGFDKKSRWDINYWPDFN